MYNSIQNFLFDRARSLFFLYFIFAVTFTSNRGGAQTKKANSSPLVNWQGTYYGIRPCADCPGIATTLILKPGNRYVLITLFLESDAKPDSINGKFVWNGNVMVLNGLDPKYEPTQYKFEKNQVKQLNLKGKEIHGSLAAYYILHKMGNTAIEDKRWKLISFKGQSVSGTEQTHYLIFHSKEATIESKVGCNQLINPYALSHSLSLKVKSGISTMMACPDQQFETLFSTTLLQATQLVLAGNKLMLTTSGKQTLAVFEYVKYNNHNWLIGNMFIQESSVPIDPTLGGPSFLKIHDKDNADIKFGDIVARAKLYIEAESLFVEETLSGRRHKFVMHNNTYLVDEYGVKWNMKNK
jgi:heat shock protein HslJ